MIQTTTNSEPTGRVRWAVLVGAICLSLAVPWLALTLPSAGQFARWPAAVSPFALNQVLIVHLIGVLPLCLWSAWQTVRWLGAGGPWLAGGVGGGLIVAAVSAALAPSVSAAAGQLTPHETVVARLVWCGLLELPWCLAGMAWVVRHFDFRGFFWVDGLICLLFALLPWLHVQQTIERESQLVADATINQQYLTALGITEQLVALGSSQIAGQPARELETGLAAQVQRLRQATSVGLSVDASVEQRLERARMLYSLADFEAVHRVLDGLDKVNPRAAVQLAMAEEVQGHWSAAAEGYGGAIQQLTAAAPLSADQLRVLRIAFERRVNNLRRLGESPQAERELRAGMEAWPAARDAFLMQLGYHYVMAGRTAEAMEFFRQAAQANSRLKPIVEVELAKLSQQAQGCLLRSTRGAAR